MDDENSPQTQTNFTEVEKFGITIGVIIGVLLISSVIGMIVWWRKKSLKRVMEKQKQFLELVVIREETANSDKTAASGSEILDVTGGGGDEDKSNSNIFTISDDDKAPEYEGNKSNRFRSWFSDTSISSSTDDIELDSIPNTYIGNRHQGKTTTQPIVLPSLMYGQSRFSDPWYDPLIERSLISIQHS